MNSLRAAWLIARQDLRLLLRQKETLLWTFAMPFLFFWFIGTVTAGFGATAGEGDGRSLDPLGVAGFEPADPIAEALVERLRGESFELRFAGEEHPFHLQKRRLSLPSALGSGVLAGVEQTLDFETDSGPMGEASDRFRIQRAMIGLLADLVILRARKEPATPASLAEVAAEQPAVKLTSHPARRDTITRQPSGFDQAVPGTMVMFALIVVLTGGASTLLAERRAGVLRRLASAPIPPWSVVLGKWLGKFGLAGVQITFAMVIGRVAFGVSWGPHLPAVIGLLACYASLLASLALLLSNYAHSEAQAVGLAVLSGNLLAALGGCWWPIEVTPPFLQGLAMWLPTGWTMDGLHKLVSFGLGPSTVLFNAGALLSSALLIGAFVTRRFKFA